MAGQPPEFTQRRHSSPTPLRSRTSAVKKLLFSIVITVAVLALLEGIFSFVWFVPDYQNFIGEQQKLEEKKFLEAYHSQFDPELGWKHIPGKRIPDFYGPGAHLTINADGLRGVNDYVGHKPAGTQRIVCLGDSFTLGYGVSDENSFPAQLEAMNPKIQAVNMGQGAYSVGQCYLWYCQLGESLDADLVVCSLILSDFQRLGIRQVNKFRTPEFQLQDGRVAAVNLPLPQVDLGANGLATINDFGGYLRQRSALARSVARIFGPDSIVNTDHPEDFLELGLAIIKQLRREVRDNECEFALVLLPAVEDLLHPGFRSVYQSVAKHIQGFSEWNTIPYLDLGPAFMSQPIEQIRSFFLIESYHHYSPAGNQFVAVKFNEWLAATFAKYPQP